MENKLEFWIYLRIMNIFCSFSEEDIVLPFEGVDLTSTLRVWVFGGSTGHSNNYCYSFRFS